MSIVDQKMFRMEYGTQYAYETKNCPPSVKPTVGVIYFASNNYVDSHLNMFVTEYRYGENAKNSKSYSLCFDPNEARALRDLLVRLYPMETYPVKTHAEITVQVPFEKQSEFLALMKQLTDYKVK